MWYEEAVFYQVFPLGFCDGLRDNDGVMNRCISEFADWIPHLQKLGTDAVYFSPIFESDYHGYDTRDYRVIDKRIGTNKNFAELVSKLHEAGIKVVIDGVFNHVGRGFFAFKDVCEKKWDSAYKDWFNISFDGNSPYNDGFWYEGWEGHYELVKLNLYNPAVKEYLKEVITGWVKEFDIDGLRLDVAYCLDLNFLKELHGHCKWLKNDFWLMGETLHGYYNRWMNPEMLDSVTNYECYKGLFSSFNDLNMFEIAHSLNRQFGKEQWCLYTGKLLYSFVDNHDVSRIATMLNNKRQLPVIYPLLFTMPGIPGVYYGSEYGIEGDKHNGDDALRVEYNEEKFKAEGIADLTAEITALCNLRTSSKALAHGDYTPLQLLNRQFSFRRDCDGETVVTLLNIDDNPFDFNPGISGEFTDVLTGKKIDLSGSVHLDGCSAVVAVNK